MKFRDLLLFAGGVAAAAQASAVTLGNTQDHVQLGAPIDLVFPFQPDTDKTAETSCLRADVWMGDSPLSSSQITLTPQNQALRLRTQAPVYEPLVTVKLHAGCAGSVSRSYTFFADPPSSMAASVAPIDLSQIQASTLPLPASMAASATTPRSPSSTPARQPRPAAKRASAPAAAGTAASAAVPAPSTPPNTTGSSPAATPGTTPNTEEAAQPRLRMEPIEGLDIPAAAASTASAEDSPASATPSIDTQTQMLLDANAARLEAMEKQLQALQNQLTSNRSEITSLQTQLVQAQNQGLPMWVYVVIAALAAALATIAWLLYRLKQERLNAQRSWADTVLAVEDSDQATTIDTQLQPLAADAASSTTPAPPETPAGIAVPALAPSKVASTAAWHGAVTDAPTQHTAAKLDAHRAPLPAATPDDLAEIAEVLTAHALFDVQEQAEFYASIGENDHAIEILQSHIAQHRSSSPLAYIELLQLLYRLSRTEAFEQVRSQFQEHFNVVVPDFLSFSRKGHDLWSGYPEVLEKIEALWPTDDVQPLLRSLIVRHAHATTGIASITCFELSAFDDLLMLYNVAHTTPASSRGQMPGRVRTVPPDIPLPELSSPGTATPWASNTQGPASVVGLSTNDLGLLHATASESPFPHSTAQDSPFQSAAPHVTPDATLLDSLSLDWGAEAPPAALDPVSHNLDIDWNAFTMDERDLPPQPPKP